MKSFKDYLAESARIAESPVTEDYFDFELMGCIIESEVIEHDMDSITVLVDEHAMSLLDSQGMLEADEEDFPLMNPQEKFTLDNPKIIKVVDADEDSLTGATDRQTGMLKAITGSQVIWKQPNTWASAQNSARVMGYMLQYVGDDNTFNAEYQGKLPSKEPMMQKGDLPAQSVSPMAEMLRLAGIAENTDAYAKEVAPRANELADALNKGLQANAADARVSWYRTAMDVLTKMSRTTRINPQLLNTACLGAGVTVTQSSGADVGTGRKVLNYLKSLQQPVTEDEVEETIKPGTKVKIHAPGKSYHDQVGHVGEIRHGQYKGAPKTYTVDYGDRKSVQLDKNNIKVHKEVDEAEYRGRKVPLGKPMRGDVKKFKVYVKDPSTGNVKKVNFGDPNMRIKKSNPARRRSFRARHNCANPGPRTKARYWSCRKW